MSHLLVQAVILWVEESKAAATFYTKALGLPVENNRVRLPDGVILILCPGRVSCNTRGPHGLVPALEVDDIAAAKAHLRGLQRPIVFEEVVPGLARLTFLDPDGNALDLVQPLDVEAWERGARIPEKDAGSGPPRVRGLFELSLYARDVPAMIHFYRDQLALETGLAYFAHIHLLFDNVPLVIRPTWHRCNVQTRHTPALLARPTDGHASQAGASPALCPEDHPGQFDGEHTWVLGTITA